MNDTNRKVVTCLLDDTNFINNITIQIDQIMEDDNIDLSDIVPIVTLIVEIVKNNKIFLKIDKKDIAEVIRCLLINIFEKLEIYKKLKAKTGLDDNIIEKKVDSIIENLLSILVSKIKTMTFFRKICKKLTC